MINLLVYVKSNMHVLGGAATYEELRAGLVQVTMNFRHGRWVEVARHNQELYTSPEAHDVFFVLGFRPTWKAT